MLVTTLIRVLVTVLTLVMVLSTVVVITDTPESTDVIVL